MKLIIRTPNWVGDAIMALPAVDIARDLTGAGQIAVMARSTIAPLFNHHPDVDRVIMINDRSSKLAGIRQAAALIKKDRFEVGIILPESFSSALVFKLGKVKGRIGYTGDGRSLLLTRRIKPPAEKMHRVSRYLYLFEKMTGRKIDFRPPRVYLSHEDIDRGEEILKEFGLSYDTRYIAMAPQAVAESRRWGTGNYAALAQRVIEEMDLKVILLGTSHDRGTGELVRDNNVRVVNLCGQTSLLAAAAIMSFARLFVGNDSGLAHLAGGVACPIVALSGADDPAETSPVCDKKTVLIKNIECISCVKNICPKAGDRFMRCMKLITVKEVFDAVRNTARV